MLWRSVLALICAAACANAEPALTLDGVTPLPRLSDGFGGLSAIEVSDGGATAVVLSDRGGLFHLTLAAYCVPAMWLAVLVRTWPSLINVVQKRAFLK